VLPRLTIHPASDEEDDKEFRLTSRTFTLLPGITIGDIGKKMGRDGIGELTLAQFGRAAS
jgi:hypothetical protein